MAAVAGHLLLAQAVPSAVPRPGLRRGLSPLAGPTVLGVEDVVIVGGHAKGVQLLPQPRVLRLQLLDLFRGIWRHRHLRKRALLAACVLWC